MCKRVFIKMTNKSDNIVALHRVIDGFLLKHPPKLASSFLVDLEPQCKRCNVTYDTDAALEYWWRLARIGAIAIPGSNMSVVHGSGRTLIITERGRRLLGRGEHSPHDPPRYLNAISQRIANPDQIVMDYVDEAVGAWSCDLNRASVVMLGCACERLILMLAEAVVASEIKPWSERIQKELGKNVVGISRLFDNIRKSLKDLDTKGQLPPELSNALDRKISAIFDHARGLRNKSGHPTGADVSSEDAEAGLLLLPGFYVLINDLISHLSTSATGGGNP